MLRAATILVVALAAPAPAQAATTGGMPGGLNPQGLALAPDGSGLLGVESDTTDYSDGVSCQTLPTMAGAISVRAATGALTPLHALGADIVAGPVRQADGSYAAVLSTNTALSGECTPIRSLTLATLDATGAITAQAPLVQGVAIDYVVIRARPAGGVAVAWLAVTDDGVSRLQLALSPAGPVTIAEQQGSPPDDPGITDAALAAEPAGGFTLAWAVPKHVRAVHVTPAGAISRPQPIGGAAAVSSVQAGAGAGGRAVIAWSTQDGGEERERPLQVFAAIRPSADARFRAPQTLDRGHSIDYVLGGMSLNVAPDGRALLAWTDVLHHHYPLYAATAGPKARFGTVRELTTLGTDTHPGDIEATAFTHAGRPLVGLYKQGRLLVARADRAAKPKPFATGDILRLAPGLGGHLLAIWTTYPKRDAGLVHVAPLAGG